MKTWVLAIAMALGLHGAAHGIALRAGDVWMPSFSELTLIGPTDQIDLAGIALHFSDADYLGAGDAFRLSLFENQGDAQSVASIGGDMLDQDVGPFDYWGNFTVPTPWRDLEGQIAFAVLAGSMIVETLEFRVVRDGLLYRSVVDVSTVPAPSAVWLWMASLPVLLRAARRARTRRIRLSPQT